MQDIHLNQVSFLSPLLDGLRSSGTSINKLLHSSGLHVFNLTNSESYIPISLQYSFFEEVSKYTGYENISKLFGNKYNLDQIGEWGEELAACPDSLAACLGAEKYDAHYQTNQRIWLEIDGPISKLHNIYIDPPSSGRKQMEIFSIVLMLNGFRNFLGDSWTPLEIHLRDASIDEVETLLPINDSLIKEKQSSFGMIFPTAQFEKSPLQPGVHLPKIGVDHPGHTIVERLENIFLSIEVEPFRGLSYFADMLQVPQRTLQRVLSEEGTSFTEISDKLRFQQSLFFLSDSRLSIIEISQRLGYANPPNFERAFRRWTSTTPQRFRDT